MKAKSDDKENLTAGQAFVFVCVLSMRILSANSIYIIGRVLSEKVAVNQLVRFLYALKCMIENKMYRHSTVTRGAVTLELL